MATPCDKAGGPTKSGCRGAAGSPPLAGSPTHTSSRATLPHAVSSAQAVEHGVWLSAKGSEASE